jgi:hypothetical protein
VFIAKARPKPPFGNPRAFQPPKQNIIIFLVFLVYIDSYSMYIFDALSLIIESSAAMSAQLWAIVGGELAITILRQIVV